ASTCRRTESGTAPPPTRSSSSWSLGQGIESISQVLQVAGAELPDPGQDARTVDVDGAGGQAQLAGDLGTGPTLQQVPLEAGPGRRPRPGPDALEGEGEHPTPVQGLPAGIPIVLALGGRLAESPQPGVLGTGLTAPAPGPVDQRAATDLPEPGAEPAAAPLQLEIRQALDRPGEDLLHGAAGVFRAESLVSQIGREQRLVERHELTPGLGIGRVADPHQQRASCVVHAAPRGEQASGIEIGSLIINPERASFHTPDRQLARTEPRGTR